MHIREKHAKTMAGNASATNKNSRAMLGLSRWAHLKTSRVGMLLAGTMLLAGCATVSGAPSSSTPAEDGMSNREACESMTVILGPINSGSPSADEFEKTFKVLEALSQEISDQELQGALVDYITKGRIVLAEIQEKGTFEVESMENWKQSVDNMLFTCAPFLL